MSYNFDHEEDDSSKSRNKKILIMLFYPFTLAMIAAGFTAFFILMLGFSAHLAATVALCFFAFSSSVLYFISKPAIELLNLRRVFLNFIIIGDILAILSLVSLFLS